MATIDYSTREYTWRDAELTSKPLRALNTVGGGLSRFGVNLPAVPTPESVKAAAIKAAGSDDFGGDSFEEPLRVFLDACREEAELTPFGNLMVGKMLSTALANRLQLRAWAN